MYPFVTVLLVSLESNTTARYVRIVDSVRRSIGLLRQLQSSQCCKQRKTTIITHDGWNMGNLLLITPFIRHYEAIDQHSSPKRQWVLTKMLPYWTKDRIQISVVTVYWLSTSQMLYISKTSCSRIVRTVLEDYWFITCWRWTSINLSRSKKDLFEKFVGTTMLTGVCWPHRQNFFLDVSPPALNILHDVFPTIYTSRKLIFLAGLVFSSSSSSAFYFWRR